MYKLLDRIDLDDDAINNLVHNVLPVEYDEEDFCERTAVEIGRVFVDGFLRMHIYQLPRKSVVCKRVYHGHSMRGWIGWCDTIDDIRLLEKFNVDDLVEDAF